jgi:hypothetical protein
MSGMHSWQEVQHKCVVGTLMAIVQEGFTEVTQPAAVCDFFTYNFAC